MPVGADLEEGSQHARIDVEARDLAITLEQARPVLQQGAQQDGPADTVVGIGLGVAATRVRPDDVYVALEAAGEVGALGETERVGSIAREVGQLCAGAAGEDEDGLADRVQDLALLERAVLHRRQEMAQPAERSAGQVRVELVPEHERQLALQGDVADLVECIG